MKRMWPDEYAFLLENAEEVEPSYPPCNTRDWNARQGNHAQGFESPYQPAGFRKNLPLPRPATGLADASQARRSR